MHKRATGARFFLRLPRRLMQIKVPRAQCAYAGQETRAYR